MTRGVGLSVVVHLTGAARHRFLEDLEKLGPFPTPPSTGLTSAQEQLLDLVAGGSTVAAAAAVLAVSRRTASRQLADARAILGVASTSEAVAVWSGQRRSP